MFTRARQAWQNMLIILACREQRGDQCHPQLLAQFKTNLGYMSPCQETLKFKPKQVKEKSINSLPRCLLLYETGSLFPLVGPKDRAQVFRLVSRPLYALRYVSQKHSFNCYYILLLEFLTCAFNSYFSTHFFLPLGMHSSGSPSLILNQHIFASLQWFPFGFPH